MSGRRSPRAVGAVAAAAAPSSSPWRPASPQAAKPAAAEDWIARSGGEGELILIKGGCVLTMDRRIGDFERADVLVKGRHIVEIGPDIDAPDAQVIDAVGTIVLPGFVDTHRHCWQNVFRRFAPSADILGYRESTNRLGEAVRPEDVYIGNLLSCLGALDTGVTTLLDWSHVSNTPEHSDAAVEGLFASGMRAVYGYGQAKASPKLSQYPQDAQRIKARYFSSKDQLVTMFMGANIDRVANWRLARELDIGITSHVIRQSDLLEAAGRDGLIGPDVTFIHCTGLSDTAWSMIRDAGASLSFASSSISQLGVGGGIPPIQKALDFGLRPSLSVDVEVSLPGDFFTQMRVTYAIQRAGINERRFAGEKDPPPLLSVRDMLGFATVEGARANGLSSVIGTLTPGKQADIILIRADDFSTMPLNNAIGTVVLGADRQSVETVLVAGRVRKWRGELVGVDYEHVKSLVLESRDRLAAETGQPVDVLGDGYGV